MEFIQWFGLVSPQSLKNSQIHCTKYSQHATWPLNLYIPLYIIQWELTLTTENNEVQLMCYASKRQVMDTQKAISFDQVEYGHVFTKAEVWGFRQL